MITCGEPPKRFVQGLEAILPGLEMWGGDVALPVEEGSVAVGAQKDRRNPHAKHAV